MPPSLSLTSRFRTVLVLGRGSNLPTVWSNCLAAWLLGGGGPAKYFAQLLAGTTLLYTGGMFLNDAVDADFDRRNHAACNVEAFVNDGIERRDTIAKGAITTTGFDDRQWVDQFGFPISDKMVLEERWDRPSPNRLRARLTG